MKQVLQVWYEKAKENTLGTGMQALVYPFGKVRASLYVGAKQGNLNFGLLPRTFGGFYNGVVFMSLMRCAFSNALPYVAVHTAPPNASKTERNVRLLIGTVTGVFCYNLADAHRQLTLRKENSGFMNLIKPSQIRKRTNGYVAALPSLLLSCFKMTFFTGPLDYAAALKREFAAKSYLEIIATEMNLAPKFLANRYGVTPQIIPGLKNILLMSTIRMLTLSFELFTYKVAIRKFKSYQKSKKEED